MRFNDGMGDGGMEWAGKWVSQSEFFVPVWAERGDSTESECIVSKIYVRVRNDIWQTTFLYLKVESWV